MWSAVPLAAMAPFTVLALFVLWLPLWLLTPISFGWVLLAFAAVGPLLFVRPFQVRVLTPILRARPPTAEEAAKIEPIWVEIARANDLDADEFVVRILDSDELNAFACGGHLVVVTRFAVEELTTAELRGVLAHELSHHLGLHTVAITVGHWMTAPVLLLARIGFFMENVAVAVARSYGTRSPLIDALANVAATLIHGLSWIFTFAIRAGDALANVVGHEAEYEADQRAVRMGFGRELSSALRRVIASGQTVRPVGWRARLAASHPPARTRAARIDALLRHPAN